jgi:hypothetical protein
MGANSSKDLGDKTWNNQQQKGDLNEGFSGENIPDNYNPAENVKETETDADGNNKKVYRARNADKTSDKERSWNDNESLSRDAGKSELEHQKAKGTEDFNYQSNANIKSPANKENRGNIELDE